jgi:urease accessory protein
MTGDRLLSQDLRAFIEPDPLPQVHLHFAADASGRTWLQTQHAAYPFHVGRCLAIAGDPPGMPTVYVQSCSGGIFEHDRLRWRISAGAGTRVHVGTSASTIVHGMDGGEAAQEVVLDVGAGAVLEYLPDPLILFPGARLRNRLRIRLAYDAAVLISDAILAHDPEGSSGRSFERIDTELGVEAADGTLLARDRYVLSGTLLQQGLPGVNGDYRCQGSFAVLQRSLPMDQLVDAIRSVLNDVPGVYAGASTLPSDCGAMVRVLAADAAALRLTLAAVWGAARLLLLGVGPSARRK